MDRQNAAKKIAPQVASSIRRLLNLQDSDPYSPTRGCFDRRFWSWKLVDYPEATYQRNVLPMAELWADPRNKFHQDDSLLTAVLAGLDYATAIQHGDGSFDQAFPQERSFAATGFLLHSLIEAHKLVAQHMDSVLRRQVENCLILAATFLSRHSEKHGLISNHMAGAALALYLCGEYFDQQRYTQRADELMREIVDSQSEEGWFPEYDGADPGYQTLCLYYLVQIYRITPSDALKEALGRAVRFIAYFLHPDGSFGGEYGSRRTAIFYPGGIAALNQEFPLARAITQTMCRSICAGNTITLYDIDMGNLAPLLSNYVCLLQSNVLDKQDDAEPLPWEQPTVQQYFSRAGLYIRGTERYYAILGVSNGGVLKVFDKLEKAILWDDGGYVGKLANGTLITTQMGVSNRPCTITEEEIAFTSHFYKVLHTMPTPSRFLLLRLLNLTFMRSLWLGNVVKKGLVRLLISGKRRYDMELQRRIRFEGNRVVVEDRIFKPQSLKIKWLEFGRKFASIHMASARYAQGRSTNQALPVPSIDVGRLNQKQYLDVRVVIEGPHV